MPVKYYQFDVAMSCSGCSGAVERVLKKTEGVKRYEANLETQKVKVEADGDVASYDAVYEKINKAKPVSAGREIESW